MLFVGRDQAPFVHTEHRRGVLPRSAVRRRLIQQRDAACGLITQSGQPRSLLLQFGDRGAIDGHLGIQ